MDIEHIFPKIVSRKHRNMPSFTSIQKKELKNELATIGNFLPNAKRLYKQLCESLVDRKDLVDALFEVTTARNKLLIAEDQQRTLSHTTVGFFGLSVGSHAALTWMLLSRADHIKIADPDSISPSNLNRLRFGWSVVGKRKVTAVKQLLLDIHPFTRVQTLVSSNPYKMDIFCRADSRVHCIVDEVDDLNGKIMLRRIAKDLRIPLLSAVDVGENVLLDIERYDVSDRTPFFLGRLPHIEKIDVDGLTKQERMRLIISLVGLEHNSTAMLQSLLSIGKDIGTWPQLGSTATISGGIIATTIKRIMLGEPIKSGRYVFDMDGVLAQPKKASDIRMQTRLKQQIRKRFLI